MDRVVLWQNTDHHQLLDSRPNKQPKIIIKWIATAVLVNETEFSWMRKMNIAQGEGLNQFRWSERRQPLKVMEIPRGPDNEPVIWL